MERISVHIVTFARYGELVALLTSLRFQTFKEWDLFIKDENAKPLIEHKLISDLLNRFKLEGHAVRYFHEPLRCGIANARQWLVEKDDLNDLIYRCDDDSILEPDLLQLLYTGINSKYLHFDVGAVAPIVPDYGVPLAQREVKNINIFNEIKFDSEGNIVYLGDDAGYYWKFETNAPYLFSHHLRSTFLFRKSISNQVGGHPKEYGSISGAREETDFSMRIAMAGYKLLTCTNAVCWHLRAAEGGARAPPDVYQQAWNTNDEHWRLKFKRYFKQGRIQNGTFTVI